MNYLAIHTQSNLILQAIASPRKPADNITTRFIAIGDITLSKFYRLLSKTSRNGRLVDIAELAAISPYLLDSLHQKA